MKRTMYAISVAAFLGGTVLTGCGSDENADGRNDQMEETGDRLDESADDFSDWLEFRRAAKEEIAENRAKIAELKVKQETAGAVGDKIYEERIENLRAENERLQERIDNYDPKKDGDSERWEEFKREFRHDMDQLGESIRDIGKDNK